MAILKDRVEKRLVAETGQTLLFIKASANITCIEKVITCWKGRDGAARHAGCDPDEGIGNADHSLEERYCKDECANQVPHCLCIFWFRNDEEIWSPHVFY